MPITAIYVPPGKVRARARRPRAMTKTPPPTYRLKLEKVEADGSAVTVHQWSGIPADRLRPVLETLGTLIPLAAKAASARDILRRLADLFH